MPNLAPVPETPVIAPLKTEVRRSPRRMTAAEAIGRLVAGSLVVSALATAAAGDLPGFVKSLTAAPPHGRSLSFGAEGWHHVGLKVKDESKGKPYKITVLRHGEIQDPPDRQRVLISKANTIRDEASAQSEVGEATISPHSPAVRAMVKEIVAGKKQGYTVEVLNVRGKSSDDYASAPNAGLGHEDQPNQDLSQERTHSGDITMETALRQAGVKDVQVKELPGKEVINQATDKDLVHLAKQMGIPVPALLGILHQQQSKLTAAEKTVKAELNQDRGADYFLVMHRPAEYGTKITPRQPEEIVYTEKVGKQGPQNDGSIILLPFFIPPLRRKNGKLNYLGAPILLTGAAMVGAATVAQEATPIAEAASHHHVAVIPSKPEIIKDTLVAHPTEPYRQRPPRQDFTTTLERTNYHAPQADVRPVIKQPNRTNYAAQGTHFKSNGQRIGRMARGRGGNRFGKRAGRA
jgi:hypothetical protein